MTSVHATPVPTTDDTAATAGVGSLLLVGGAAAVAAAAATSLVAVVAQAVGISLDLGGAPIPPMGFAVLTLVFSAAGLVIATVLRRFARRPRTAWIRTTATLTVLSLVPDVLADAAGTTKAVLMLTHLLAAAIVIPAVARRLR